MSKWNLDVARRLSFFLYSVWKRSVFVSTLERLRERFNLASFLAENILYHWTVLKDCRSFKGVHQNWTLYIPSHFTRKENIFPNAILKEPKTLDGVTNTSQAWRVCSSRYLHRGALQKPDSEEEDSSKRPWILPVQHLVNTPKNFINRQKRKKLKPIPAPSLI